MFNRMVQKRQDELKRPEEKRPYLATECTDVNVCERWRKQIIKEISKEVTAIQNGSLGEHKIRDMNDHINKLLREKKHWERQIKYLGGADYAVSGQQITDLSGKRPVGSAGYFYFGAARELPGVRELFDRMVPEASKRTRGDLHKLIDADYYGYGDEDDGLLLRLERAKEGRLRKEAVDDFIEEERVMKKQRLAALGMADDDANILRSHVDLPSSDEIEKQILENRKKDLLARVAALSAQAAN